MTTGVAVTLALRRGRPKRRGPAVGLRVEHPEAARVDDLTDLRQHGRRSRVLGVTEGLGGGLDLRGLVGGGRDFFVKKKCA